MLLAVLFMLALVVAFIPADTQAKKKAKVKLNKTSVTLAPGGTAQLKLENNKKKVKWSSSKTSVATVNGSGLVTAKAAGNATVTAKVGKKSYKCKVTVKNVLVTIKQRGTKADKEVRYVYKRDGVKNATWSDYIFIKADDQAKADAEVKKYYDYYYDENDELVKKQVYKFVDTAVVEMTDTWVGYQNFDATVENYTGAHRYNIGVTGKATLPAELVALIKDSDDMKRIFGDLYIHFAGYKSYAPYKGTEQVIGFNYYLLNNLNTYSKIKGASIDTTYDKTTGAFNMSVIDVRWDEKVDFAELTLNWSKNYEDY
jgi:hypothetical protein